MLTTYDLDFFAAYPKFSANPKANSSRSEFKRLAKVQKWKVGGPEYCEAKWKFKARIKPSKSSTARKPTTPSHQSTTLDQDLARLKLSNEPQKNVSTSTKTGEAATKTPPSTKAKKKSKSKKTGMKEKPAPTKTSSPLQGVPQMHLRKFDNESVAFYDSDSDCGVEILTPTTSDVEEDENGRTRYFARFPLFEPDDGASLQAEFDRLAELQGWAKGSNIYRRQLIKCYEMEFRYFCGSTTSKLEAWQSICLDLEVETIPGRINQCKKCLEGKYVNIFDFIDCKRGSRKVEPVFSSIASLRRYTTTYEMIFPKATAKDNPMLRVLLNKLFGYS